MIKIGIVGLGYMGKTHLGIYQGMGDRARVVAIAEPDEKKRGGDLSSVQGNLDAGQPGPNLDGVTMYPSLETMLAEADIDAVDITLPTYLHRDAALACFAAGKHVLCEKPMALGYGEAMDMVAASEQAGLHLFVGQCIRFWPAYAKAREMVLSGKYGPTRTAAFTRLSPRPGWIWQNWSFDAGKSGGAALDLHIHDADFITWLYGRPAGVSAFAGGRNGLDGAIDHIVACYHFDDEKLVTAVGAWEYPASYPFSMTFSIQMETAALVLSQDGNLTLHRDGRDKEIIPIPAGDGWLHELDHFVSCLAEDRDSDIIPPRQAAFSVQLVRAEIESARNGRRVELKAE